MTQPDEQIKINVVNHLNWNNRVNDTNIKVDVFEGKVVLSGNVSHYAEKKVAALAAGDVIGVSEVINKIKVILPNVYNMPFDEDIKFNAERVLRFNSVIDMAHIQIFVERGFLKLKGYVDAYWKKDEVERLVIGLAGVIEIENLISVVPTQSLVDAVIAKHIQDAFDRVLSINVNKLTVQVANGIVTLNGKLASSIQRSFAHNIASATLGVVGIKNQIIVSC